MFLARLVLIALCLEGAAFAEDPPTYAGDDGTRYGRAHVVVQPEYPQAALRERKSGAIAVTGVVDARGEMESPALAPEDSGSQAFVEPLRKALRFWSFYTPVERDCMPSSRPIKVRVEFKAEGGVNEVATRTYPKHGDASGLEPFAREVRDGLGRLRFAPDSTHSTRYVCYTVEFNLRD